MARRLLRWALLGLAMAGGVVQQGDLTYGPSPAGPNAWIDVAVFWINMDRAVDRAAKMKAQLRQVLLPGTVATRVSAITYADLARTVTGGLLFSPSGSGTLRFNSPTTHIPEIAIMSSHLKAIYLGSKLGTGPGNAFLVLEDDVDLLFFPRMRRFKSEWPTAKLSADGLRRSFPEDWSFAMLMVITLPKRWRLMWEAWEADGQTTAVRAERLTEWKTHGCDNKLWSAGAYFVRGPTAADTMGIWPVREHGSGGYEVNVTQTCWHFKTLLGSKKCTPEYNTSAHFFPNFVSDQCLLHRESFGPVLDYESALTYSKRPRDQPGLPTGKLVIRLKNAVLQRTYAVTPPLVVSHLSDTDMAHPDDFMVHNKSMAILKGWWDAGEVPDVRDDAIWWWNPPEKEKRGSGAGPRPGGTHRHPAKGGRYAVVKRRREQQAPKVYVDMGVGVLEEQNLRAIAGAEWKMLTNNQWRYGVPEIKRGMVSTTPFVCAHTAGCRAPDILATDSVTTLRLPLGRFGEAFNPAMAALTRLEAAELSVPDARYVATVRYGHGQQCLEQDAITSAIIGDQVNMSTVSVMLLDRSFRTLESTQLRTNEPNCEGFRSAVEDCRIFRHGAAGLGALWLSCLCHSFEFSRKVHTVLVHAPYVSPLKLRRSAPGGALVAEFEPAVGGFLMAAAFPAGAGGRWRGGQTQRNQLLFSHAEQLYAHWAIWPTSVVVSIPRGGAESKELLDDGLRQGELCCSEPVELAASRAANASALSVATLELGALSRSLRLAAGFVPVPKLGLLLGVAKVHRDLWRKRIRGGVRVPREGTHYTHVFFALGDWPPFPLLRLGAEFCLPRRRPGVGMQSRAAELRDNLDCNVVQIVTSVLLENTGDDGMPPAAPPRLLLAYGFDDCASAIASLDYEATLQTLLPVSHWMRAASH
jgi:hypothetical protein